ncbi:hypothetical protein [Streptomyces rubiginosohelvolus]|uniref:hypothetical protein n=1 Tax=Streptomyces rubiginosohelvolus TaxID=67362 RepID=UPI003662A468
MSCSVPPCNDLGLPHGLVYARRYVTGWKCDLHTPRAIRGLPECPPGPGWPPRDDPDPTTDPPPAEGEEPPS